MLLSMRNKFLYSCSIKIHTLGFSRLLESIFCLLMVMEVFSLQKVVEMLKEVVLGWWEIRWIWQMRQTKSYGPIRSSFEVLVVQRAIRLLLWRRVGLTVDQCWMQALQFSMHLIDLLSILLRYNGFTKIQKAVVDQLCNRPPNKDQGSFLVQVWLWKLTWSFFSATELVIASYCIKFTFCCTSQFNTEMVLFCSIEEKKMTF